MPTPSSPPTRTDRFFSVAEVATLFKVSEVTIYREIAAGELPAIKLRGRYVVPAKAVDQLEADALAKCTPGEPGSDDWSAA